MNLSDLLRKNDIDPQHVLVLRHRPPEPKLNEVFRSWASEKPEVFNAYQQTQGAKVERAMQGAKYVASFIGHEAGKALFVGLYSVGDSKPLTVEEYWRVPAYIEMRAFGTKGFTGDDGRKSILWFDLALTDFCSSWKGKLIVKWPPQDRAWWRWADRNEFRILAILEDSALDAVMPRWDEMALTWEQLKFLPTRWKASLSAWRGIYYIFDASCGRAYVGSAYGADNLLGRWLNYAATGHGGNKLLRGRDPQHFRFSLLQLVA